MEQREKIRNNKFQLEEHMSGRFHYGYSRFCRQVNDTFDGEYYHCPYEGDYNGKKEQKVIEHVEADRGNRHDHGKKLDGWFDTDIYPSNPYSGDRAVKQSRDPMMGVKTE